VRIFNPLFSESPVNNVPDQQLFLKGMPHAEPHPADDTDRHRILIHSLFCTHITLHRSSSLFDENKRILIVYHGKGEKSKEIIPFEESKKINREICYEAVGWVPLKA
jgi:hypothetical protein